MQWMKIIRTLPLRSFVLEQILTRKKKIEVIASACNVDDELQDGMAIETWNCKTWKNFTVILVSTNSALKNSQ